MKAVISAQAGIALLLDETGNRVIVTGETPENTTLDAALHTLRYTQDAAEVDCESVDGLRELLQQRHACDVGLRMFLILIDRHEDHGTRLLAGKCCEQRLQSADVREFVIHRLYTKPLPEDADTLSALVWSMESNWAELQTMLQELMDAQVRINALIKRVNSLPTAQIVATGHRTAEALYQALADAELVRTLCRGLCPGSDGPQSAEKLRRAGLSQDTIAELLLPGDSQPASTPSADAPQPALMMIPRPGGRQI